MNKIEIEIIQHSPILHFQPDLKGSTLRASEVKPKLDKYLVSKLNGSINKDCYIDYKHNRALNYSLKIEISEEANPIIINFGRNSPYFGKTSIRGIFYDEPIKLVFLSFHTNLLNFINDNINEFLLINNFGHRQNKGFGSFTTKEFQQKPYEQVLRDNDFLLKSTVNSIERKNNYGLVKKFVNLFNFIDKEYKILKSGINITSFYKKSILLQYFKFQKVQYNQ